MRLTVHEVEAAITTVAGNQRTGDLFDYSAVTDLLNERLAAGLVGRSPVFAGKHQREAIAA